LKEVAAKSLPAGYGYEFAGMSREELKAGSMIVTIFAISIVFVFLFLAALYESWSVPFSVLLPYLSVLRLDPYADFSAQPYE